MATKLAPLVAALQPLKALCQALVRSTGQRCRAWIGALSPLWAILPAIPRGSLPPGDLGVVPGVHMHPYVTGQRAYAAALGLSIIVHGRLWTRFEVFCPCTTLGTAPAGPSGRMSAASRDWRMLLRTNASEGICCSMSGIAAERRDDRAEPRTQFY
jgi:hypothetical protein